MCILPTAHQIILKSQIFYVGIPFSSSFIVVKLVFQYYAYKSFFALPTRCGDSLLSLRSLCVFGTLLLGFQQYLYGHLYFTFKFVSIDLKFYVLPIRILMHSPFISVFCFGAVLFLFCLYHMYYCAICNDLFRSSLTVYRQAEKQQLLIPCI